MPLPSSGGALCGWPRAAQHCAVPRRGDKCWWAVKRPGKVGERQWKGPDNEVGEGVHAGDRAKQPLCRRKVPVVQPGKAAPRGHQPLAERQRRRKERQCLVSSVQPGTVASGRRTPGKAVRALLWWVHRRELRADERCGRRGGAREER